MLDLTSFPEMLIFVIRWCSVSMNGAWINHMSYLIDRYCVYRCVTVIKGVSSPMCLFLGKMTLSGLILIMVHRIFVGSLGLNILSSCTTKRFLFKVDCVPASVLVGMVT